MNMDPATNCYAFSGPKLIAQGQLSEIILALKTVKIQSGEEPFLLFDRSSGLQFDLDLSGTEAELATRYGAADSLATESAEAALRLPSKKGRGRPKLGVVGREVTLLPRHWQWLDQQRGGSSAALRRLIEEARKAGAEGDQIRLAQDSANRFMNAVAGNLPGFEESIRALYAQDRARFEQETAPWPADIRRCAQEFAGPALN
jgi:hypothetical protein